MLQDKKKCNLKKQNKHQNQIHMTEILKLSDREIKITMINILRNLMEK